MTSVLSVLSTVLLTIFVFPSFAQAETEAETNLQTKFVSVVIPDDTQVLNSFGHCTSDPLPRKFNFLSWNIHKGTQGTAWAFDLEKVLRPTDIAIFQEGMLDNFMPQVLTSQDGLCWDFAASFIDFSGHKTGVVTGSVQRPQSVRFFRSPTYEPILKTPKMTILTEYQIEGSELPLLVVNIHGINFVEDRFFEYQITELAKLLKQHQGPMIFAGDFNNRTTRRQVVLHKMTRELGLYKARLEFDSRLFKIDHIYFRGLRVESARVHGNIKTSDHAPISADFSIM